MSPLVFRQPKILIQKAKRARKKQTTKHYEKNLALSKQMGNAVGIDLFRGLQRFKKRISVEALKNAWEKGDYHKLMTHVPWEKLPEDLNHGFGKIKAALGKAADLT